ncbi:MAG: alpha/beta fold hydrolase [bacterium]
MASDYTERVTTRTEDGVELSAGVVRPTGEPRAVVLAGHAMMVDARTLDRPLGRGMASVLAERGFLVVAADFRGHGRSGTPVSRGGQWTYDDLVLRDFPALLELARSQAPGKECVVLGHSLMGHVGAAYLGLHPDTPVRALIAISSNLWLRNRESELYRRARKAVDITTIELLTRLFGHFPARRLRMGSMDESGGYMRQLCDTYHRSRWRSTDGTLDYHAGLANIRVPTLAVIGKGETYWCTEESVHAFFAPVPAELFTCWRVGAGHLGLTRDPGHIDIVTDPRSAPLWHALADWILELEHEHRLSAVRSSSRTRCGSRD